MRSRSRANPRGDDGAITAEFAVALPAVVGVLALCLSAVGAVSTHTVLTALAVESARAWARGESWDAVQASVARRQLAATATGTERSGATLGERCVTLAMPLRLGSWMELGVLLEETACAPIEP